MSNKRNFFYFLDVTFPSWKNLVYALSIILIFAFFLNFFLSKNSKDKDLDYQNLNKRILSLAIPRDLNFAGELVPQNDFSVGESLEREFIRNTYWHSNALLFFNRASRWFPIIEPILKKNGIPEDFKYLAVVESKLTNSISPRGASGFWQIMKPTAKSLGLEVNDFVDERFHIQKSTEAACKYILQAFKRFNSWTLAAASYNMGMGGLELQLRKQNVNSYYDLLVNEETGRYLFRILAIKNILQNPKHYGFEVNEKDFLPSIPNVKIEVANDIHDLSLFAKSKGYSIKILKIFNPWIRGSQLKVKADKKYEICFPEKRYLAHSFEEMEKEVLYQKNNSLKSKKFMVDSNQTLIHIVVQGESLKSISEKYKVRMEDLCMWNHLTEEEQLLQGFELLIYTHTK